MMSSLTADPLLEKILMMQEGDKKILLNVAKVIAILIVVMFSLIILASYIGGTA